VPHATAATRQERSPWEAALGEGVEGLHPQIRAYVRRLPAGSVGRGVGRFDVIGTPRRWLRPALAVLARQGVLAPAWERGVPFVVSNRLDDDGWLRAERTVDLARGAWTMRDAVTIRAGALIDDLGVAGRYRATLAAWVEDGALRLRSTGVSVRIGALHLPLPSLLAPVVHLREGFDDGTGRQRVHLRVEHPLLGRLYEYRGTFGYGIEEGAP
jgi:hypothetical protein